MKQKWKEWFPAISAILILMTVEIIDLADFVPSQQRDNFELISNSVMFVATLLGLIQLKSSALPDAKSEGKSVFNSVVVTIMTFPMNIGVFQHKIRPEQFLTDIWGVHLCWLLWFSIQILLLTGLGYSLLKTVQKFFKWIEKIATQAGGVISRILDAIKGIESQKVLVFAFGILCWGIYLGVQCSVNGIEKISDINFLWKSIWIWIIYLVIYCLVQIFPLVLSKIIEELQNESSVIVVVVTLAAGFIIMMVILPSLFNLIVFFAILLLIPSILLWYFIKETLQIALSVKTRNQKQTRGGNKINLQDLKTVYCVFILLPLAAIILTTALLPEGMDIITNQSITDMTTWMNFISAAVDVSKMILELLI